MTKDPSAASQVFEWLQVKGKGSVVFAKDAAAELPHLDPSHVAAALSLLAQPQNGVLIKLEREYRGSRRYRPYQITKQVEKPRGTHAKPNRGKGEASRAHEPAAPTTEDVRAYAKECLFEAAIMIEDGEPQETILEHVREGYHAIKQNRLPGVAQQHPSAP